MRTLTQATLVLLASLSVGGCANTVTVHYRQLVTTAQYHGYNGPIKPTYPDLLVIYDICTIDNTRKNASPFIFSLQKVGAQTQSNRALGPSPFDPSFAKEAFQGSEVNGLGLNDPFSTDGQVLLAKGTSVQAKRRIIVRVKDADSDLKTNDTVKIPLVYDTAKGEPGILFTRDQAQEQLHQYVEILETGLYRPPALKKPPCSN